MVLKTEKLRIAGLFFCKLVSSKNDTDCNFKISLNITLTIIWRRKQKLNARIAELRST